MTSPRRLARLLPLLLAVPFLGTSVVTAATPATSPAGPVRSMALGVSMDPWGDLRVLDGFAAASGRMPAIWMTWGYWAGAGAAFPSAFVQELRTRGVTPMVNWMPADSANLAGTRFTHTAIANGDHDAYIRRWAQAAKDSGGTVLLRLAHEMDGSWYSWGMKNGNTPASFVAMWRHVWNLFRGPDGLGATNVKFVWSPTTPGSSRPAFATLYPGDAFVDYASFTSYNWARRGIPWKSMVQLYAPTIKVIRSFTNKPMIVAETASTPIGGDKAAWVRDGYRAVYAKWSGIKAIVYFNADARPKHKDWRLTSPTGALDAYRDLLTLPQFQGHMP